MFAPVNTIILSPSKNSIAEMWFDKLTMVGIESPEWRNAPSFAKLHWF